MTTRIKQCKCLECNNCGHHSGSYSLDSTFKSIRKEAKIIEGWISINNKDYCYRCAKKIKEKNK